MSSPRRSPRTRIAVIGAGSAYMPSVLRGLITRAGTLEGSELVFYDIDAENVELVARLARKMFAAYDCDYTVQVAPTIESALTDVGFVFTTFRPGGLPARYLDESIPLRHCILGQETIGPGGFFMAQRAVPAMLEIARLTEQRSPGAWIVNYTNPTNLVTDAVLRFAGYERMIGICDQYVHDQLIWAQAVGLDPEGLEVDWYGTNHCTSARTVRSHGVDASALVAERLTDLSPTAMRDPEDAPLALLGRDFGYFVNHYSRYYYLHDEIVTGLRAKATTRAQDIMAQLPGIYENFATEAAKDRPEPDATRGGVDWGEFAVDTICAVAADEGRRMIINTRNNGAITDLEDDAVVEVPATVDAGGVHAQTMGALPHPARGLNQAVHEYEYLAVNAAATGDLRVAQQALMAHPLIRSREDAVTILDEGMSAHHDSLPQYSR